MEKSTGSSPRKKIKYCYDNDTMSLEWWQKNVMYHLYLPSFKDSDCDGFGDFKGLISKLDYFEESNIKTLLISPYYPSPMKDNGYDITSYVDIDCRFGTMEDFVHFIEEIKKRDMNVVVDLVANHTSNQHEWFQKSIRKEDPFTDFYIWKNKNCESTENEPFPPNNWLSVFGGSAWTWNDERKQFYFHQFLNEQPDLNLRNPLVVEEIKNVMAFWLDKGVDGFRIDAASHLIEDKRCLDEPIKKNTKAKTDEYAFLDHIYTKGMPENLTLLKELRTVLNEFESKTGKPKIIVAEVVEEIEQVMKYYGTLGRKVADFPFNFSFYKLTPAFTGVQLFDLIDSWLKNMPKGKYPNWVVSSHDDKRIISRLGRRLAFSIHMVTILLPGVPIIYYGDEIGMENTPVEDDEIMDSFALRTCAKNSRDPMRTPMQWNCKKNAGFTDADKPWLPINKNYNSINVEIEKFDPLSYLNLFKLLFKFCGEPTVLVGLLEFPVVTDTLFTCLRYLVDSKCFFLALNMSSEPLCVDLSTSSRLIPSEAYFEVSSGHFPLPDDAGLIKIKSIDKFKCQCNARSIPSSNSASSTSANSNRVISLKKIHLLPKEATIFSFIGKRKL